MFTPLVYELVFALQCQVDNDFKSSNNNNNTVGKNNSSQKFAKIKKRPCCCSQHVKNAEYLKRKCNPMER